MAHANYLSLLARKQVESIVRKVRADGAISPLDIMELSERDLDLIYSMGHTFYETGQYEKAKVLFTKLVLTNPFVASYWKALGSVSSMLKESHDSLIYYSVSAMIDPVDPTIHLYAAKNLIDLNRLDEARGALVKAEELAPKEDLDFHSQLEVLYERCSH
ncbi:MAG: hypothetical protein EB053_04695 [Chlamydiae bacterium]|nr:hypothetical protein [Chlamydiota bacterium]